MRHVAISETLDFNEFELQTDDEDFDPFLVCHDDQSEQQVHGVRELVFE